MLGVDFVSRYLDWFFFLRTAFGALAAEQGLQVELFTVYPSGPHSAGDRIQRAAHVLVSGVITPELTAVCTRYSYSFCCASIITGTAVVLPTTKFSSR
jgi:hypothetical protein